MPNTEGPGAPTAEHARLAEADAGGSWRLWGPYLSERQWGTVREDYSSDGDAWSYLPHDQARSRAYRWGEDGLAGWSDDRQLLCLSLALWNGADPILKERMFGLTNSEGNHGEDVKEVYHFLDATPTHSYLRMLYRYPQRAFPYGNLLEENGRRTRHDPEYEIVDTGVFADGRFFDVTVEYAKPDPDGVLMRITVANRGPETARIHVLPQLTCRNTWSWSSESPPRPSLEAATDGAGGIAGQHPWLGAVAFGAAAEGGAAPELLFCDNETDPALFGHPAPAAGPYKNGFHLAVAEGRTDALRGRRAGTKAAAHVVLDVPPGEARAVRARLSVGRAGAAPSTAPEPADARAFDALVDARRAEADAFYAVVQAKVSDAEERAIQRQALAGMIWSKQCYRFEVDRWIKGDPAQPAPPPERGEPGARNTEWRHLNSTAIMSMPDTWEYPWFAAWDLAFQCLPLALVDPGFAKEQLVLLTREWFMHPNGQLPAYEWNFSDTNPPVHAWATWRVFEIDRAQRGDGGDLAFLERIFHKLLINFTWWVNRKDARGMNVFQGGFLGMDNVGVFDRDMPVPGGGTVAQADGSAYMAMYALNMMRLAIELSLHNPVYQDIASKFFEHFLLIAEAMTNMASGAVGLWDEQDEFYYDRLKLPSGDTVPIRVRSAVGLVPLFAVEVIEPDLLEQLPEFSARLHWVLKHRPDLAELVSYWTVDGAEGRRLLSLLRGHRMGRLLNRMLDEGEFLSPHGVRSLSRYHLDHPYSLSVDGGQPLTIGYRPAESDTGLFGGNSNWRGPLWFPINHLAVESLRRFDAYYRDEFLIECPTGSGHKRSLSAIADELSDRLVGLFRRDPATGRRPIAGDDLNRRDGSPDGDPLVFNEYFHGDTGQGLGASHQTGWTGLVAMLIHDRAALRQEEAGRPK